MLCIPLGHAGTLGSVQWLIWLLRVYSPGENSGTSKTKAGQGGLVQVALFWNSHCATCSPACVILYHMTGSCKGPIRKPFLCQDNALRGKKKYV